MAEQAGGELVLSVIDLGDGHRELWKRIPNVYSSQGKPTLRRDSGSEILRVPVSEILVSPLYRRELALNGRMDSTLDVRRYVMFGVTSAGFLGTETLGQPASPQVVWPKAYPFPRRYSAIVVTSRQL